MMNSTGEMFLPIMSIWPKPLENVLVLQDYRHSSAEESSFARLFGDVLILAFFSPDNINICSRTELKCEEYLSCYC